jgi:hypothetical protein
VIDSFEGWSSIYKGMRELVVVTMVGHGCMHDVFIAIDQNSIECREEDVTSGIVLLIFQDH